jgi:hypothetical protein
MPEVIKTDRYVSYRGIDCCGNAKLLMARLRHHLANPQKNNKFWDLFVAKLGAAERGEEVNGRKIDEIFLIHAYINNLQEFFAEHDDTAATELLEKIERECC